MANSYEAIIGLEVHAQLTTQTKIFCGCATEFGADPNSRCCPVCLGLPGALPVLNQKAVEFAIKAALATHCQIAATSVFARKNYFYPDLPKGYQISQFDRPIAQHGYLNVMLGKNGDEVKRIGITRIHMEEDAGKLLHDSIGQDESKSLVDLNRAGTPLIEIVSEPDIRSGEEAAAYLRSWRQILRYLGICDGNLEEGSMRCDANVSVRKIGEEKFRTKAEVKNLNSFKNVQKAIEYEIARQTEIYNDGGKVVAETRLWDATKNETRTMRSKEEAQDYRYFPDPDLRALLVSPELIEKVRRELPELPTAKLNRFQTQYNLSAYDAAFLIDDVPTGNYFEAAVKLAGGKWSKELANWIMGDLSRLLNKHGGDLQTCKVQGAHLVELVGLIDSGKISGKMGKDVLEAMFEGGEMPAALVVRMGVTQINDAAAIEKVIVAVLDRSPAEVEQFNSGKDKLFGFFVGQVMKESKGQANPALVNQTLKMLLAARKK